MFTPINQNHCEKSEIKIINPTYPQASKIYSEMLVKLSNGSQYSGSVLNDSPYGEGKEFRSDGILYTGTFRKGKWHGKGTITTKTLDVYDGEFISGYFCGI